MLTLASGLKVVFAAVLFGVIPCQALEFTLGAVEDTLVVSSEPNRQSYWLNGSLASRRQIIAGAVNHEIWSFLKFELPPMAANTWVQSAVFRGFYTGVSNDLTHELATVVSDDWYETSVTWNNMPGIDEAGIATFKETNSTLVGQPFELDVTDAAAREYFGDGLLTLVMRPAELNPILNRTHQIAFGSSNSSVGLAPALILTIVPEPSTLALVSIGIVALAWRRRAASRANSPLE